MAYPRRTPVWLDCDTGHDDAIALLLAGRSSRVMLLGVSTVYGNASLRNTTYNTSAILKAIHREDTPVYAGADKPFKREVVHAPGIHGESGLDGTTCLPKPTVLARDDVSAVEAIWRALSAEAEGTAWLVATGSLTNAAAVFKEHPELVEHIAGLSIMGGAVGSGFTNAPMGKVAGEGERFGNHTPYAEFNIYCDPEAADEIFSNAALAAKTTLVPLDLTHQFLATSEVQMGLLFGSGGLGLGSEQTMAAASLVRRLFFEILNFFAKTYREEFGLTAGPPTHDPLAVAVAFRPDLFYCNKAAEAEGDQGERFRVEVVTEGEHGSSLDILNGTSQCGRTIVTPLSPGEAGVRIPRGLDSREIWSLIEGCLQQVERAAHEEARNARREEAQVGIPQFAERDMISHLSRGSTSLSELEVNEGIPDISMDRGAEAGDFLETRKDPGALGAYAVHPGDFGSEHETQAKQSESEQAGSKQAESLAEPEQAGIKQAESLAEPEQAALKQAEPLAESKQAELQQEEPA